MQCAVGCASGHLQSQCRRQRQESQDLRHPRTTKNAGLPELWKSLFKKTSEMGGGTGQTDRHIEGVLSRGSSELHYLHSWALQIILTLTQS